MKAFCLVLLFLLVQVTTSSLSKQASELLAKFFSVSELEIIQTEETITPIFNTGKDQEAVLSVDGSPTSDGFHIATKNSEEGPVYTLTNTRYPGYSVEVKKTEQLCDTVTQYAGYLHAGKDKNLFFWFFEARNQTANRETPLLLWLNGGPGCSSLTGLFMELGPCTVDEKGEKTVYNPYSWNNQAHVIFLDQPTNVGYSYGTGVSNSVDAAKDVYAFLHLFLDGFAKYRSLPFHLFGESYGGHYVPAIAQEIIKASDPCPYLNLTSIGIGNGLVDPLVQYEYYPIMACNSTYDPVLPADECKKMSDAYSSCSKLIEFCYNSPSAFTCLPAASYCNNRMIGPYQQSGRNPYDVRLKCDPGNSLCYPILSSIETFLNREEVKKELGVKVSEYKSCNMDINRDFFLAGDWMRPYHRIIPGLLVKNIRVLVYAGDADFICNWYGNKAWTLELDWIGKEHFNRQADESWFANGLAAGEIRRGYGLVFLRLFEAGHMVPYDQPKPSLRMINDWMFNPEEFAPKK